MERYRALGLDDSDAPSPLNAVTEATRASLETSLGLPVFTGMRHWEPRIATAVGEAIAGAHDLLVGLVLAPHWSTMSIARYEGLFDEAVAGRVETRFVRRWGMSRGSWTSGAALSRALDGRDAHVVFTAHSLPARILEVGDTYPNELLETSRLVADRAELRDWSFSYQSESERVSRGSAPTSSTTSASSRARVTDVVACPIGFVSEHLEIRWDIDVEAARRARGLGHAFARIEMPNDDRIWSTCSRVSCAASSPR